MTPYFGTPITPETAAVAALRGAHGFISHLEPRNVALAISVCQSWAGDNGAFSAWSKGRPITDWLPFYEWARECMLAPNCDFVVIPDVIDGDEIANDRLLDAWPLPRWFGAPVWHMHESLDRLERLATDWPRICLGSSAQFARVASPIWWQRIEEAMRVVCDSQGRPLVRMHGLRMLRPEVINRVPLASADSTNIARNIGIDQRWTTGSYPVPTKEARAVVIRLRTEVLNSPQAYRFAA